MQRVDGKYLHDFLRQTSTFFEADINVDAVLSFPWMAKNKIGVFPHLRAMALEKPKFTLRMGAPVRKTHMQMDTIGRRKNASVQKSPSNMHRRSGK